MLTVKILLPCKWNHHIPLNTALSAYCVLLVRRNIQIHSAYSLSPVSALGVLCKRFVLSKDFQCPLDFWSGTAWKMRPRAAPFPDVRGQEDLIEGQDFGYPEPELKDKIEDGSVGVGDVMIDGFPYYFVENPIAL